MNDKMSDGNNDSPPSPFRSLALHDPEAEIPIAYIGNIANSMDNDSFANAAYLNLDNLLDMEDKEVESYNSQGREMNNSICWNTVSSMHALSQCPSAPSHSRASSSDLLSPLPDFISLFEPPVPNPNFASSVRDINTNTTSFFASALPQPNRLQPLPLTMLNNSSVLSVPPLPRNESELLLQQPIFQGTDPSVERGPALNISGSALQMPQLPFGGSNLDTLGSFNSAFRPLGTSLQPPAQSPAQMLSLPALETRYPRRAPAATQYSPVSPFPSGQPADFDPRSVTTYLSEFCCDSTFPDDLLFSYAEPAPTACQPTPAPASAPAPALAPAPASTYLTPADSRVASRMSNDAQCTKDLLNGRLKQRIIQRGEDPRVEPRKPIAPVNTPEVESIRQRRRERNRDAARKARNQKRQQVADLEKQVAISTEEKNLLDAQCKRLKKELQELKQRCEMHVKYVENCPHKTEFREVLNEKFESKPTDAEHDESSGEESTD